MTATPTVVTQPDDRREAPVPVDFATLAALVEQVAQEVDVMAGLGHVSAFTEEGQARRRAADLLRGLVVLLDVTARERDADRAKLDAATALFRKIADFIDGDPDYDDWLDEIEAIIGAAPLPNRRVMDRLWRDVEKLADLCDHPYDLPRDGSIHMTSTRGFHTPGPDGRPLAVGLSLLTCPSCRPLVEKAVDAATGGHDDEPWPRGAA